MIAVVLFAAMAFADGEQKFADLGRCKVQSREVIQDCQVGYRTWGQKNAQSSNVVVLLTWFTGNTGQLAGLVSENGWVDPAKYYVVAIDALANGLSSSPSNSKAQPRLKFPQITIPDMVESQHRVLTETLKLDHVHAVMGGSMGGMQSFQWAVQYPEFMDVVVPIVGSTQLTPHDLLLWRAEKSIILGSKEFNDGNYASVPVLPGVADIHHLELETPAQLNREIPLANYPAEAEKIDRGETMDPCDRIRQLEAMMSLDLSKKFGGDMAAAAKSVKAKMLIVVAKQDHMVNPDPARHFAELLGSKPVELDSDCGHLAPGCEAAKLTPLLHSALE